MTKKLSQETKLLSPKLDIVFRCIFGDPKNIELLTALLKSILDLPKSEYERIEIVNPFSLKAYPQEKEIILDVKVHTTSGKIIDVELQCQNHDGFASRIVYYVSKLTNKQLERGDDYAIMEQVIAIVIMDFTLLKEESDYHNRFHLRNDKSGCLFSDIIEVNTIELPKLPDISDNTELWNFMQFLNAETEEEMEAVARENPTIQKTVAIVRELSRDEKARMYAEAREKAIRDEKAALRTAMREGREEGLEQGREEGERNKSIAIARNLKAQNISVEIIAASTGLSAAEIESL